MIGERNTMERFAPLSSVTRDPREAMKIIADQLLELRPAQEPVLRPYRRSEIYQDLNIAYINLKKLYPEAKAGNVVYVCAILDASHESDGALEVAAIGGKATVCLNGEQLVMDKELERRYATHFVKGPNNKLTIKMECSGEDEFELRLAPTSAFHRYWAKWYILNVQVKSPIDAFAGEAGVGISRLYENGDEVFDGSFVYPVPTVHTNKIDFNKVYPEAKGRIAYALTYATADTELELSTPCVAKAFVNGSPVECGKLVLAEGDEVLLKLLRSDEWCFTYDGEGIGLPMVESKRGVNDKWLLLASFSESGNMDCRYGPELEISFNKPYLDLSGDFTFWRLNGENDYVRAYLQTCCYGQWFYPLMVATHGLLRAGEALNVPEYKEYFLGSSNIMTKYFDFATYEMLTFGRANFLEAGTTTANLDQLGSMGRNLCEYYKINPSSELLHVIEVLAESARVKIPRFEDGTYHRPYDMWADDMFMSCPFLVRLGKIKRNDYYYEEVIRQFRGFNKRLWMADEQIMSHIFFLDDNKPNNIPWGRGNGWVYVSLSDALENIPEGFEGREFLMDFYHSFTEGLARLQDADGLWHQVLNRHDSYQETSCTGMFMLGMCRGIKNGWLDRETYMPYVMRAYNGLLDKKVSATGNVYDVCRGSSNSKDVEYYMNLAAIDNDDHGTGVILTAISEMLKIL